MEPIEPRRQLLKRYYCDFDGYCYRTSWDVWGRWVASAIIVITIVLLAFLFSQRNRRRRNHGLAPMYGTGWIPGSKFQQQNSQNQHPQYGQHMENNVPAPPYAPTGTSYAGQQQNCDTYNHTGQYSNGIELQQPPTSYQPPRVETVYEPPHGPPPGKGDR
ncbi:unnamed protein product [Blumeria hordei]|uniref:Uncharacterized protein n=1 Tax=Blumeria hordei TaxID=2867405 RepID=A0A383URB9_BLUHO|nr:unnamed protein product [Blumeria hordei]